MIQRTLIVVFSILMIGGCCSFLYFNSRVHQCDQVIQQLNSVTMGTPLASQVTQLEPVVDLTDKAKNYHQRAKCSGIIGAIGLLGLIVLSLFENMEEKRKDVYTG